MSFILYTIKLKFFIILLTHYYLILPFQVLQQTCKCLQHTLVKNNYINELMCPSTIMATCKKLKNHGAIMLLFTGNK
jgi:hypothetical protein